MNWDLEERVEDAFVAYLTAKVPGAMRVYPAFAVEALQFPCVVIGVASTEPVSEQAEWHDSRSLSVDVQVLTEAAPVMESGNIVTTARERNAAARSPVMDALATTDLKTLLIAAAGPGVAFSMAQVAGTQRSIIDRVLVTNITVEVIAEPIEE